MNYLTNYPVLLFLVSFIVLWLSSRLGRYFHLRHGRPDQELREDFGMILTASLTLLGLIIGFSFSMAINRYDQRKNYEEAEANAIGTEYARLELLPVPDADKLRPLLRSYLDERIAFYVAQDDRVIEQINARTAGLHAELWSAVVAAATARPTPVTALAVSGMNDVLNSQGYTQAGFWNRIPPAAWSLIGSIAIGCNLLVGYGSRSARAESRLLPILPLLVSTTLMFIADIDSPRQGLIHVNPQNLTSLAESLRPHDATGGATTSGGQNNH
jgi:hypothetical protein